ncbi:DNA-protecting protein DprA [Leucobacter triazinivorans]|uniref:DNA-protecting protein DprA n=2 Tax=Leucobacter triazinivorans TaxID=1784719 RepID=A0A4P6KJC6_9MICO|nr:DNA-protecting protein DprA [Leucobacter triazinivorans]
MIRADSEFRTRLEHLTADAAPTIAANAADPGGPTPADTLLARIVWARLVEPGDAIAGGLVGALGPVRALDLVASNTPIGRVRDLVHAASGAEPDPAELARAFARWRLRLDRSATIADLERGLEAQMRIITPESEHWPSALADLGDHAPLALWVRGDHTLLARFSLAVVGARACTGYGSHITAELTESVCETGTTIISGAAYGVDAVAHRTALALGAPTVAVLAGGADRPYPSSHGPLLERISESGAVCSEMVPGSAPTRWRFLQRNRSIAALARATLVTEAGVRSGSLNTAGHAAELGRALGAVPGPVTSAASAGCHRLLREYGATLVTNGAEVREFLGLSNDPALFEAETPETARQPARHRRVLDALPLRGGRTAMEAARRAGLDVADTRFALAELELLGAVARRETPGAAECHWVLLRRQ